MLKENKNLWEQFDELTSNAREYKKKNEENKKIRLNKKTSIRISSSAIIFL